MFHETLEEIEEECFPDHSVRLDYAYFTRGVHRFGTRRGERRPHDPARQAYKRAKTAAAERERIRKAILAGERPKVLALAKRWVAVARELGIDLTAERATVAA